MAIGLIICATALASDALKGTAPRSSADKYNAHAEQNGVTIGATLLTAAQVRKAFFADVNRCCLVVEVALYPPASGTEISLDDFTLRVIGQELAAKPSTAKTAALHSSQDRDRVRPMLIAAMEQELSEKSLPSGHATAPVSGYLYFSLSSKVKKAKYELEYVPQGNKTILALN
jgi:hypothetical protein